MALIDLPSEGDFKFVATSTEHPASPTDDVLSFLLDIEPQDEFCKKMFNGVWGRMSLALATFHEYLEKDVPRWTQWKPGKWYEQKEPADRQKFAAWVGPVLVGMLNLRPGYPSAYESDSSLMYIEHIATAPGNQSTDIWCRKLEDIGSSLTAYAILQSWLQGYDGRIGLHAADERAESYYRHLGSKYSLFLDPPKQGIPGTPQEPKAISRMYFEADPLNARRYLEVYRDA